MPVNSAVDIKNDDTGVDKTLSWDEFFERADNEFNLNKKEEQNDNVDKDGDDEEHDAAYKNLCDRVATLPHKKAICYGVCTISETPKLVKCEDCGLVVNMVGFGHHRKVRHTENNLLTRKIKENTLSDDDDDFIISDSEDDCQGFLLSPPHHFPTTMSNLDGSPQEYDEDDGSLPSTPIKVTLKRTTQQLLTTPPIYGVEKRNDLRLVLKRTPPDKIQQQSAQPLTSQSKQQQNQHQRALFQQQTTVITPNPKQQLHVMPTKKPKKPQLVRVFGSKKKRKGGAGKKKEKKSSKTSIVQSSEEFFTLDDDNDVAEHQLAAAIESKQYRQQLDGANRCYTNSPMHVSSSLDTSDYSGIVSNNSNSNDSTVTIPAQLTPCGSATTDCSSWDPREAAERPTILRGGKPVGKVMPIVLNRKGPTTTNTTSITPEQQQSRNRQSNMGKVAGPSILKRSSIETAGCGVIGIAERRKMFEKQFQMQQQQQMQQPGSGISVLERLFKSPAGVVGSTLRTASPITDSRTAPTRRIAPIKNTVELQQKVEQSQQQPGKMMQQQQRRFMQNDYDCTPESMKRGLFSDLSCEISISDKYLDEQQFVNLPQQQGQHRPLQQSQVLDQFSSTTAEPNTMAAIRSSFMNRAKNRAASNALGISFEQQQCEFQNEQQKHNIGFDKSRLLIQNSTSLDQSATPATKIRQTHKIQQQQRQIECAEVDQNNISGIGWKRMQQQHHDHYYHQQTRKIFSSTTSTDQNCQQQQQFITSGGTRFVPMDPRGLALLRKNSSTNSFAHQQSNSSNPSPAPAILATATGSGSRSAMSSPSISVTGKNINSYLAGQRVVAITSKTTGTSGHDEEESISGSIQHQIAEGPNPSATSTSNSCASTPSNVSTSSSNNNNLKNTKDQTQILQQQQLPLDAVLEDETTSVMIEGPITRKRQRQHIQLDADQSAQLLNQMQQHKLGNAASIFPMTKRFRQIAPRPNDTDLQQLHYGQYGYAQQQQQPHSINMDALSPTMIHQHKPISQHYYLQQQRNQQQHCIVPQNVSGQTSAPTTVYNAHRQQLLFQKRYPAANTQQLGPVFTIMQQQPQQYRPMQQQMHHSSMIGIRPSQQQQHLTAPNGIIRTIAVNTNQLFKINGTSYQGSSHFDYGGSPPPTYQQHQSGSQLYQHGPPQYSSGIYSNQQPPDPAWEFVIGSSPPPTDYFAAHTGANVVVGGSGMTEPFGHQDIVHTPAMYNQHYQQPQQQHFLPYNQMGVQINNNTRNVGQIHQQHQQQSAYQNPPQYNVVGSTIAGATIRRLSLTPQSTTTYHHSQQQIPAFLQPTTQQQTINNNGCDGNFDYANAGTGRVVGYNQPKQYVNPHISTGIVTSSEKAADIYGLDLPPVLEAEGALPINPRIEPVKQLQPHIGTQTSTSSATVANFRLNATLTTAPKTISTTSNAVVAHTPNPVSATTGADEDDVTNTRSSSASDLDLRDVLQTGATAQIQLPQ